MLQLDQISLAYGQQPVIDNLSFRLTPGQRLGLCGPSGSGKTSILQLVAGLLPAQSGQLSNSFQRMGYVFQSPRMLPWLSVRDNIALPLEARGQTRMAARQAAERWLPALGLAKHYSHVYPAQLSGGMAQRVSLARAFALEPDLLLLDEPFSALDPALRHELSQLTDQLLTRHTCALLYVSHHPQELAMLSEHCLLLQNQQHQTLSIQSSTQLQHLEQLLLTSASHTGNCP